MQCSVAFCCHTVAAAGELGGGGRLLRCQPTSKVSCAISSLHTQQTRCWMEKWLHRVLLGCKQDRNAFGWALVTRRPTICCAPLWTTLALGPRPGPWKVLVESADHHTGWVAGTGSNQNSKGEASTHNKPALPRSGNVEKRWGWRRPLAGLRLWASHKLGCVPHKSPGTFSV